MNSNTSACSDVRAGMLEADAADLRGEGDPAMSLHLRGCPACAADARRLLDAQQSLADALATLTASPSSSPVNTTGTAQPISYGSAARGTSPAAPQPRRRTRRFGRRLIAAATPLAAAAVLVLLLVRDPGAEDVVRLEPASVPVPTNTTVVNVAAGRDVAVMQTSNPNITVVWYLNQEIQ